MFEHRNHKITVKENGSFETVINGAYVVKSSLAAIKKEIESSGSFEPFMALIEKRYENTYTSVRVVGVVKAKGKKTTWNRDKWLTEIGTQMDAVVKDTPENRSLLDAYKVLSKQYAAEKAELTNRFETRVRAASEAIPYVRPE